MKQRPVLGMAAATLLLVIGAAGCGAATTGQNLNQSASSNASANTSANTAPSATSPNGQTAAFPITLKDDTGHTVTISKRPVRIASTTEGTDEILSALVPKKDIVLVTTYSSDPAFSNITSFVKGIPAIQNANAEQIIAVHPDLVLMASYTTPGVVNQIEQAHIPTYEFNNFNSVSDIEHNIEVVGQLVGNESTAKALVQKMQGQIQSVKDKVKGATKPTVLDYSSYGFAAGSNTTVNSIIDDAGGINAAAKLNGWQKISDEEIVKLNPQVIIDASNDTGFVQKILSNPALSTVSAVKNHRVYSVNGPDLTTVSQYITRGVRDVAKVLHPNVHFGQ